LTVELVLQILDKVLTVKSAEFAQW